MHSTVRSQWLGREAAAGDVDAALFAALLSLPMPLHAALRDLTPQSLRAKTLRALEAHILRRARGGPGLLVVEDIHWMDPSTGDLVGHLVDRLSDQRILLLATARPEFDARWTRRPHVTLLMLNRLGQRDATSLAAEIPGAQALPPEHLARLLQRAGGNPLFIEELTRAVAEALAGDGATSSSSRTRRRSQARP